MGFFDKLFGNSEKKKEQEAKAAMHRLFDSGMKLLNDDAKQNALMPEALQKSLAQGGVIDALPNAKGAFGRTLENPIPVNGPLGEITYLSRLVTAGTGQRVGFHRLGSMKSIDVYEVVSTDGASWDILFFNYYHAGKSKKAPDGYNLAESAEGLTGTSQFTSYFPGNIRSHAMRCSTTILGFPMPHPSLRAFESAKYSRPSDHAAHFYAVLDLICAANHQIHNIERRFKELDNRIEEGKCDTEKFLARDLIRQALMCVGSPSAATIRSEIVLPITYRNDLTCLELCCAMSAAISFSLANYEPSVQQEVSYYLHKDLFDFFAGYIDFYAYMETREQHYREALASSDSMAYFLTLIDSILDVNETHKDNLKEHREALVSPVAFLVTFMEGIKKNLHHYIETEFLPRRQAFPFDAADSALISLRDTLATFFQKELNYTLDAQQLVAFADMFPVLVFITDSFYTPFNRIFTSGYIEGKLVAYIQNKCLFPEVLQYFDDLPNYTAFLLSALNFTPLYLGHLEFTDLDEFAEHLSDGEITELTVLETDKLRLLLCSAANNVAAAFALPGDISLGFNENDLEELTEEEEEPFCTAYKTPSDNFLPEEVVHWQAIRTEIASGMPDDAIFKQVAPEEIEEEYSAALHPGRLLLADKADLPENALGSRGQGLLPHVPRFDLSVYFDVYKTIRMQEDYVLDYVYAADHHGGEPFLYAKKKDSPALKNANAYCAAYNLESLGMLLGADPTIENSYPYLAKLQWVEGKYAAFERALFCMTARRFYLFWHSLYHERAFILTRNDMLSMQQNSVGSYSKEEYDTLLGMDLLPKVTDLGGYQRVSLFNYEQNTGYSWLHVYFKNQFFVKTSSDVILKNKARIFY